MAEAESAAVEQVVEQTVEIEEVVGEALELLDQIRYSLKTLEDRLSQLRSARQASRGETAPGA
jgi:uncharacterized coiled-coil protein SlyX